MPVVKALTLAVEATEAWEGDVIGEAGASAASAGAYRLAAGELEVGESADSSGSVGVFFRPVVLHKRDTKASDKPSQAIEAYTGQPWR